MQNLLQRITLERVLLQSSTDLICVCSATGEIASEEIENYDTHWDTSRGSERNLWRRIKVIWLFNQQLTFPFVEQDVSTSTRSNFANKFCSRNAFGQTFVCRIQRISFCITVKTKLLTSE